MRPITFPYKTYRDLLCPIILLGLHGPHGWKRTEAYVDSGASVSIFTVNEAKRLGIRYETGAERFMTVGDGSLIPVYLHDLPIQIGNRRLSAAIGFSPRLGVGFNLLGRQDIFSHFDVTFSDIRKRLIFTPVR